MILFIYLDQKVKQQFASAARDVGTGQTKVGHMTYLRPDQPDRRLSSIFLIHKLKAT